MSVSVNRVELLGNLGKTPELRFTKAGTPVLDMRIATNDSHRNKEGVLVECTEWSTVVVWGKTAELCAKYLTKGRQVRVEGKLRTRQYEDKAGQKRQVTEIVAQKVDFLGSPRPVTAETPKT